MRKSEVEAASGGLLRRSEAARLGASCAKFPTSGRQRHFWLQMAAAASLAAAPGISCAATCDIDSPRPREYGTRAVALSTPMELQVAAAASLAAASAISCATACDIDSPHPRECGIRAVALSTPVGSLGPASSHTAANEGRSLMTCRRRHGGGELGTLATERLVSIDGHTSPVAT